MQLNYSELKKKKVVNLVDGKDLGKVTDLVFNFPQGDVLAFIVSKKSILPGDEFVVNLCCVEKIGDDAVLVRLKDDNLGCDKPLCDDETE